MRLFALADFHYWVLAVFFGLVTIILIYMAWGSYPLFRSSKTEEDLKADYGHEIAGSHRSAENPIAPFLIFVYAGVILWVFAYVIFIAFLSGDIG